MKSTFLKDYRKQLGITQVKMANELGIKPNHYNMIENGKRGISVNLFQKISELCNKPMEQVFFDAESHIVRDKADSTSINVEQEERKAS